MELVGCWDGTWDRYRKCLRCARVDDALWAEDPDWMRHQALEESLVLLSQRTADRHRAREAGAW